MPVFWIKMVFHQSFPWRTQKNILGIFCGWLQGFYTSIVQSVSFFFFIDVSSYKKFERRMNNLLPSAFRKQYLKKKLLFGSCEHLTFTEHTKRRHWPRNVTLPPFSRILLKWIRLQIGGCFFKKIIFKHFWKKKKNELKYIKIICKSFHPHSSVC